jgi:ABC-type multidrug transport system permease subunit
MYLGLAIMMGTVWVRLTPDQDNIEYFQNSIFFGTCFMSFMAVAYVPAYIEDRNLFIKERENGLYGPTSFMVANFVTGLVPLFLIAISFSLIDYWLSNFRPAADGFWLFVMWLFLDLLAAEGLVVLVTNIIPVFIAALASVAFVNGLWMIVEGYMVRPNQLNPFWRYVFHYIDYLAYVFQGMMVNEFGKRTYACQRLPDGGCHCLYSSPLEDQCLIAGTAVLEGYGYRTDRTGLWVGILIAIIFTYRLLAWGLLYVKRH